LKKARLIFILIFVVAAGVRLVRVWQPVNTTSWREADLSAIARNYYREGMNPFYPRIDWRGTGPGFTEMEFPLYPWTVALFYQAFGVHEIIARLLSYALSLLTLYLFFQLAQRLLPMVGAAIASLCFALSPLPIFAATAIHAEGLMLFGYVAAAYTFIKWVEEGAEKDYWLAIAATALTILAKASAAHIGLLFAVLLLSSKGFRALRQPRVWLFGIAALSPGLLWYMHAHQLWLTWGNSMGLSNEYPWAGPDLLTNQAFLRGITKLELTEVWIPAGVIGGVVAVLLGWRIRSVRISLVWLAACMIFYLVAARTTMDNWAFYYHIFSAAPVALMTGAGVEILRRIPFTRKLGLSGAFTWGMVAVLLLAFAVQGRKVYAQQAPFAPDEYQCIRGFASAIPGNALILASGGPCTDADGYRVAWNASYIFYWLDRRGFNICEGEQSLDAVRALARRGAEYFVADKTALHKKPGFEAELRSQYQALAECGTAVLFRLTPPAPPAGAP